MKPPRLSSCPHCGTPVRVQLLAGTDTEVGTEPCPADWCPARTRRDSAERLGSAVALVVFALCAAGACGLYYAAISGIERDMAEECVERGGTWAPVRGYFGLPSGQGTCAGRDR